MKINKITIGAFLFLIYFASCQVPELPPSCGWTYNAQSVSFQPVALRHPSGSQDLDQYNHLYGTERPIDCFSTIFDGSTPSTYPQKRESQIKIVTTLSNCSGVLARTNTFNNANFLSNVDCATLRNLDRPNNGTPKVVLEIKAGPHRNQWNEEGFVIWTKTFTTTNGNPYVNQNGDMNGKFVKNQSTGGGTGGSRDMIYRDGLMISF